MRVLFTTGHPAQIHNFLPIKKDLEIKGHEVFWLATEKDISKYLLDYYGINYTMLKKPGKSFLSKGITLLKNTWYSIKFLRKNKIDIVVSRFSPYLCLASCFTKKTHIAITDTESAFYYDSFFGRFVSTILTAKSFKKTFGLEQIRFDANIELFYLHPKREHLEEKRKVYNRIGVKEGANYAILRFVGWDAFHDKGLKGFSKKNKLKAVKELSKYAKVFVSAENQLPAELEKYRIKIPPEKMHDTLKYAALFFGESATMASESAVLGTPAVYLNENWFGSTNEEAEFGLLFPYKERVEDQENAISKAVEILMKNYKKSISLNHEHFLQNKIDVTAFMVWFIENYPESAKIMKENPDYQYNFK